MKKTEIISKIKALNLPQNSYVVFGSAPLAVAGIREAKDIDLFISKKTLSELERRDWKKLYKGPKDEPLTFDVFEAHDNWDFSPYSPTLKHLLSTATVVDGIPFASLEEVKKWKAATGTPKHLADIKLIDEYLANSRRFSLL